VHAGETDISSLDINPPDNSPMDISPAQNFTWRTFDPHLQSNKTAEMILADLADAIKSIVSPGRNVTKELY